MSNLPEYKYKGLKKLYAILVKLGYDFRQFTRTKESRIIFQKLVYSLQKNGFQLGYNYNLYINGPYSPGLASDGFLIIENLDQLAADEAPFNLSDNAVAKLNATKAFLDQQLHDTSWLETITTLDYLYNCNYEKNKEAIFESFGRIKPHLNNRKKLEKAWSKILSA